MKQKRIICIFLSLVLAAAVCINNEAAAKSRKKSGKEARKTEIPEETAYQKLFKGKKYSTEKGLFTVHFTEDRDIIFEMPKNLLGKDMIVTSTVESSSDGGNAIAGYTSPKLLHIRFIATDSLVLLTKVSPKKFLTEAENVRKAVDGNNIGAVMMSFPIETLSPDSTCIVFKATEFFKTQYNELDPVDPFGGNSFGGLLSTKLSAETQTSMLTGAKAFPDNVSVYGITGYSCSQSFAGMSSSDDDKISVASKRSIVLLPERTMKARYSDPRIGVRSTFFTKFSGEEQGSSRTGYACRWNLDEDKEITFYVDTLFPAQMAKAISDGIEIWNYAFAAAGMGKRIKARPYPKDSTFNSDDFHNSCVKYDISTSNTVREHSFTDPRSGEILKADIYVPFDILKDIHAQMIMEIGAADKSLKTGRHDIPVVYEGLQSIVSRNVASCLGLEPNLAASYAVPVDSLRSPSFTSSNGLAASITDVVPYNFIAKEGDKEKGVRLVNSVLGPYDKYAIRWLYGNIDGASSPEEELPFLDRMIKDSRKDPYCLYIRYQPNLRKDPRVQSSDLGNDHIRAAEAMKENFSSVIEELGNWLPQADPTYTFMPYVNAAAVTQTIYMYSSIGKTVGGIYMNESYEGDGLPSYETVPFDRQKAAFRYMLESFCDLSWLDRTTAYKDVFFMRCPSGFTATMIFSDMLTCIENTKLCSSVSDGKPYTMTDAYNDASDIVLKDARTGKTPDFYSLYLQYILLNYTLDKSNVVMPARKSMSLAETVKEMKRQNYAPVLPNIQFNVSPEISHQMYKCLLDIRKTYIRAIGIAKEESARNHYRYLVMAIDRALKID